MTRRRHRAALAGLVALALAGPVPARAIDSRWFQPDDLWQVVHYLCVPSSLIGLTAPCSRVIGTQEAGIAILAVSDTHLLTVPTRRISGIESPVLLEPGLPNYWQAAWEARRDLVPPAGRKLQRSEVVLALNSRADRSQNQLHIHTGCLDATARRELGQLVAGLGTEWQPVRASLPGGRYRARWLAGETLAHSPVFDLLDPGLRHSSAAMARQTIGVVGAVKPSGEAGFVILLATGQRGGDAHAEAVLDPACR